MALKLFRAEYRGKPCTVREVTQEEGEYVNTDDGLLRARQGDYVALDLVKAPRGYKSRHIEKVVRAKDNALVLMEALEQEDEPEETEASYLEDEDA